MLTLEQSAFGREGVYAAIWGSELIEVGVRWGVRLPYSERVKNMMYEVKGA